MTTNAKENHNPMPESPVLADRDQPSAVGHTPAVSMAASQGTTIEQSRAVAEAQAAVVLAQNRPRSVPEARRRMALSCSQPYMADDAFYKFKRGGQTIRDLTVEVARELAACWGNIEYGLTELARDDRAGVSEMKAWAWDVETNTRASSTFIVPHRRDRTDKKSGKAFQDQLQTLRDVQDNNASIGGRRLRQAIFSVLPAWFREEAHVELEKTIKRGDGRPLPDRVAAAVGVFEGLGVTVDQIEQKLGRPRDRWTEFDVVELLVSHRSIQRGEVAVDEEFPQRRVTASDLAAPAAAPEQPRQAPKSDDEVFSPPDGDTPPEEPPSGQERPTEDVLRASLKAKKITIARALKVAQEMHGNDGLGTIEDVVAHPEAGADLADWIDQQ